MWMRKYSRTVWKFVVLAFVVAVICFLPIHSAQADVIPDPPPVDVIWLSFTDKSSEPLTIEGLQIIGCNSLPNCGKTTLLHQYGTCDGNYCVRGEGSLTTPEDSFVCSDNICRWETLGYDGLFRILVQFSGGTLLSDVEFVPGKLNNGQDQEVAWKIVVGNSNLYIMESHSPMLNDQLESHSPRLNDQADLFINSLGWLGLSILVELLVAGLCFQRWARTGLRGLMGRLLLVLLVNLLSLPVVWLFFPSLGQLQSQFNVNVGIFTALVIGFYTILLVRIYHAAEKTRWWKIALTVLSIPLIYLFFQMPLDVLGNKDDLIRLNGLSTTAVVLFSEVFAVVYEAILLTVLSKRTLPVKLCWVISLLMNTASFLTGKLFMNL